MRIFVVPILSADIYSSTVGLSRFFTLDYLLRNLRSPFISPKSYISFKVQLKCLFFCEALLSLFPHEKVISPCSMFSIYFVYTANIIHTIYYLLYFILEKSIYTSNTNRDNAYLFMQILIWSWHVYVCHLCYIVSSLR